MSEITGQLTKPGHDRAEAPPSQLPTCPRCGAEDRARRFYGPCAACYEELGATMRNEQRAITVEGYVPKMNVVPNQIATKE